jgi:predicted patatin/cPLA2 family phospholipase
MKCAYSAGALMALATELGIRKPDIFVAASGSVGSMFYYLAEQYEDMKKIWTRYLPTKAFISYFPFPSMRIDYLVDTVFKQFAPLDVADLDGISTRWFVPVTDVETGHGDFITNETWFDPYEVMRAAKAIPILYNGHVRLGGSTYLDGDFSTSMKAMIERALKAGAKKLLIITNTDEPGALEKAIVRAYAATLHPNLRASVLDDLASCHSPVWPSDIRCVSIRPSRALPASVFSRDQHKVGAAFQMGYDDLLDKREKIEELFHNPVTVGSSRLITV